VELDEVYPLYVQAGQLLESALDPCFYVYKQQSMVLDNLPADAHPEISILSIDLIHIQGSAVGTKIGVGSRGCGISGIYQRDRRNPSCSYILQVLFSVLLSNGKASNPGFLVLLVEINGLACFGY
jgi:hypothetical protein